MSDYLSSLFARSFDRIEGIPLVSPRLPSPFEPQQEIRGVSFEGSSRTSVDDPAAGHGEALSLPTAGGELLQMEQTPGKRKDIGESSSIHSDEGAEVHRHGTEPHGEAKAGTSMGNQSSLTVRPKEEMGTAAPIYSAARASESELQAKLDSVEEKRVNQPAQLLNRSEKELGAGNARLRGSVEEKMGLGVSSGQEAVEQHDILSPLVKQRFRHPIESALKVRQNSGHREGSVKQEPTIQVTIGRIEVRAVPPLARNRPKPKGPDPMSLDEYLRGRSGGGR
jgi:hypothetical protein